MIKRLNKACKFFPCHKGLEDCTFCWCPFYPCLDERFGKYTYSQKQKKEVWSCRNCSWIHKGKTVDDVFTLISQTSFPPKKEKQKFSGGVIILGHGSRLKKANAAIPETIKIVKRKLKIKIVAVAYLQLCRPNLTESIRNLVLKGCQSIIIVPFFLFNGNHVTRDIPEVIREEMVKYPKVKFIYTKNLGEDMRAKEIVVDRVKEAMTGCR